MYDSSSVLCHEYIAQAVEKASAVEVETPKIFLNQLRFTTSTFVRVSFFVYVAFKFALNLGIFVCLE